MILNQVSHYFGGNLKEVRCLFVVLFTAMVNNSKKVAWCITPCDNLSKTKTKCRSSERLSTSMLQKLVEPFLALLEVIAFCLTLSVSHISVEEFLYNVASVYCKHSFMHSSLMILQQHLRQVEVCTCGAIVAPRIFSFSAILL